MIDERRGNCKHYPEYCRDEEWFVREVNTWLKEMLGLERDLPFVFIDAFSQTQVNIIDPVQQKYFQQETEKLWDLATESGREFQFRTIEDILRENKKLAERLTSLESRLAQRDTRISELELSESELEAKITDRDDQIINLKHSGSEMKGELDGRISEKDKQINELKLIKLELEEKTIELEKAQSNSDGRLSERESLINELKLSESKQEEKIIELEKSQSNFDGRLFEKEKQINELKLSESELEEKIFALEKSQSNFDDRLSEKEDQISDLKQTRSDLEGQIAERDNRISALKEYMSECEALVEGNWGDWSSWSSCSVSCGGGTQYRTRSCNSTSSSNNGTYCEGEPLQHQNCNEGFLHQNYHNIKNCLTNRSWIKVFSHDVTGGLFKSDAEALSKNGGDPSAKLFSRLDLLEIFRREDGKFRFKIVFPDLGGSNEWIQTSNPATSVTIKGYEPVNIDYKVQGRNKTWRGLGLCTGQKKAFICDTPTTGNWWMCVGCESTYNYPDTIPGPWSHLTKKVELYVQQ